MPYPLPGSVTDKKQSTKLSSQIQIQPAEDNGVVVKISNRQIFSWIILVFFVFWRSFIIKELWTSTLTALITLPLLVPGICFLYIFALTDLVNQVVIKTNQSCLSLSHSPLPVPWEKSIRLPIANIKQIFISRGHQTKDNSVYEYPVLYVITKKGERIQLYRGGHSIEEFVTVRKALLRSLNIPVEPIAGEAEDVQWIIDQKTDSPVNCNSCGVAVNPGPFCRHCGSAYPAASIDSITAPLTSISPRYRLNEFQDGIKITWQWRADGSRFLLWFAVVWCTFVLIFSSLAIQLAGALFHIILFNLIGVVLAVYAIAINYNVTEIRVSSKGVNVKTRPVPALRGFQFRLDEVDAVFAAMRSKLKKNKKVSFPVLEIATLDGQKHRILSEPQEAEIADFEVIAREINSILKNT